MKKFLKIVVSVFALSFMFVGCGGNNEPAPYVDPEFQGAPKWVMVPFVQGAIAEMGSAPKNAGNDRGFQREEAMANARDNLARQISTKVKNMFKSFKSSTSAAGGTFDKTTETVSKQIAKQTLNGTRQKDMWISRSGTMYVLMIIDAKSVSALMEEASKSAYGNDEAAYQRFMAAKAQGELDKELAEK
jgi:hypothetical protein